MALVLHYLLITEGIAMSTVRGCPISENRRYNLTYCGSAQLKELLMMNHANEWMGGWMGGQATIWAVLAILVVIVVVINKVFRNK
jgi:hypothetical protein